MREEHTAIELYLIGGFLGSGKTTFMKQLLTQLADRRVGIIVNEFGSISIDAALFREDEIQLVEINNGSVFCACLKHGFTKTLKAFSSLSIDLLLIESSGMADPSNMHRLLEDIAPYLDRPFAYRGLITLLDAVNYLDYVDVLLPLQNQIAASDLILVNKTDLADRKTLQSIQDDLLDRQPDATIMHTMYARVGFAELTEKLVDHERVSPSFNTPATRPESFTLVADKPQAETGIFQFCEALAETCWRIKGFMKPSAPVNASWLHVEATGRQILIEPAELDLPYEDGRLVLIGPEPEQGTFSRLIEAAWDQFANGPCRLEY